MLRYDKNEQQKGGEPSFSVSEALLAMPWNEDELACCRRAAENPVREAEKIRDEAELFSEKLSEGLSNAEKAENRYSALLSEQKRLADVFLKDLCGEKPLLWRNIGEDERKETLRSFYRFVSDVSSVSCEMAAEASAFFESLPEPGAAETLEFLKKSSRICVLICDDMRVKNLNCDEAQIRLTEAEELLCRAEKLISDACEKRKKLLLAAEQNDEATGRMLKLLDTALDVKNKGKNMNLTAAANCVRSFLAFNAAS